MAVKDNIANILSRINSACERAGRSMDDITVVGVTKTFEADKITQAIECGIKDVAENRVQELVRKYDDVSGVSWHLIGHLQTNKVKYIADKVSLIHSVDSLKLAAEIDRQAEKNNRVIDVLIEVNVSGEESKFGVAPGELDELLSKIGEFSHIKVQGLMTMAPLLAEKDEIRQIFKKMYKIFIDNRAKKYNNINMGILSMGMSNDFEIAIEEGATMVRIGRAMFAD